MSIAGKNSVCQMKKEAPSFDTHVLLYDRPAMPVGNLVYQIESSRKTFTNSFWIGLSFLMALVKGT